MVTIVTPVQILTCLQILEPFVICVMVKRKWTRYAHLLNRQKPDLDTVLLNSVQNLN